MRQRAWCWGFGRGGITMTELEQTRGCERCEFKITIHLSSNFVIMGCTHKPYKGKWVAEIDKCPRDDFHELCKKR